MVGVHWRQVWDVVGGCEWVLCGLRRGWIWEGLPECLVDKGWCDGGSVVFWVTWSLGCGLA